MKEIGGYIELDTYSLYMLHDGATALNCGRNALAYLIRAKGINKILIPKFLCDSVRGVCEKEGAAYRYYSIGADFLPKNISLADDEWLYVVNYYGQLGEDVITELKSRYSRMIIDNAQAYFDMPVCGVDTLYTCRKFFGVPDGAFLYTDAVLNEELPIDESFERMRFLLGRFERTASEFYGEYAENNRMFSHEPLKRMSRLTDNLLHGIDYDHVKQCRTDNFSILHDRFMDINQLKLTVPEGAFMYPLYISNGEYVRKKLIEKKIYIPMLWPDVLEICNAAELEYDMANNILPLPVDQRYGIDEMEHIISMII